jgi:hypothetical protein
LCCQSRGASAEHKLSLLRARGCSLTIAWRSSRPSKGPRQTSASLEAVQAQRHVAWRSFCESLSRSGRRKLRFSNAQFNFMNRLALCLSEKYRSFTSFPAPRGLELRERCLNPFETLRTSARDVFSISRYELLVAVMHEVRRFSHVPLFICVRRKAMRHTQPRTDRSDQLLQYYRETPFGRAQSAGTDKYEGTCLLRRYFVS